ncbi:MAG: SDR family NAD(P)-dependent oxidoreductase [Pseudomonadales bacterium]|nr:SDR family NAD(P)-dependent oxidoreductase [Pseudomonadales bacterium]MCP5172288.1 SDR family NAD(P)-dependent oxidoreductase [Pseudomonadales bacterium]
MCKRFVGKKVVVTGGAQGIGKSAAKRIGLEGATVLIVDKSEEALNVVEELKQHGVDAHCVLADLESHEGVCEAYENALNVLGHIDVLVNNVGGTIWLKPFIEYQPDQIEKEVSRSFWPTMWSCYVFAKYFVEQRAGVIVNVSSIASRATYRVPYSSCKGGVNFLTTSLAMELGEYGIRVNAVAPGATDVGPRKIPRNPDGPSDKEAALWISATDEMIGKTPLRRVGTPEDQASAIAFLASDDSAYMTGEIISVGGGFVG